MPRQFYGNARITIPWRRRFWAKVRKTSTCWLWTCTVKRGRRAHEKRAMFKVDGRWWGAARYLWTKLKGPIPEGLQVLHTCDNSLCVRLSHLWIGTQLENIEDMKQKGRARNNPSRGEESPSSKLTEKEARRLIRLRGEGWLLRELELEFEIGQAQISRIVNGHRWTHLQ